MKITKLALATPLLALFLLSACGSSEPATFGERLENRGDDVQKLGKQWSEGNELIVKGNKLVEENRSKVEDAEEELAEARAKQRKGESMITKGTNLKLNAETAYQQKYNSPLVHQ